APVEEIPVAATTEDKIETIVNPIIKAIGELKEAVSNMGADSSANVKAIKAETVQVQRAETAHGFARPTSDKAVMQQITTKFQLIQAQHGSEIRMQLKPEHLGSVKISLEIQQDTVVARLQVDSDRVKHIVETNLQQLRDTLAEQGLKMEKCEVSVNNGSNDFFKRELSENGRRIRGKIRQEIGGGEGSEAGEGKGKVDSGRGLGYSTVAFVG
ncbi:MAG: flagellar hook-length control protein FliK, partial [Fibrobacteres bacterium]|nr:flagellar hook-length control protein FliK [Fibrobacterota bacterium]